MVTPRQSPFEALTQLKESLSTYLNAIPALFWRIDIVKNEIVFLNDNTLPGLADKSRLLLKNMEFARENVLEDDWDRFLRCFDSARTRRPVNDVFRIKNADGTIQWIKIAGMPDPVLSSCTLGFIMDFTFQMNALHTMTDRPGLASKIDLFDSPVLLIRFSDRRVAMANNAAQAMLGYTQSELQRTSINDLLGATAQKTLHAAYESLIFSDVWNGEINVTDKLGAVHPCEARIRAISREGDNFLWLSINHVARQTSSPEGHQHTAPSVFTDSMRAAMSNSKSIKGILKAIHDNLPSDTPTDAVMLSRIFIGENKIQVTGAGEPFESVAENDTHSYSGSIAENIVKFGLEHLVMGDTSKSIKPIDWALFIPRGIRSYYAQPFYVENDLRYVLIFCSTKPDSYTEDTATRYRAIFPAFMESIARCLDTK